MNEENRYPIFVIPPMIRSVIFDWNGTLLADTRPAVFAFNKICEKYNKPQITLRKYREFMEIPVRNLYLQHGFTEEQMSRFGKDFQAMFIEQYEPLADKARLRKGARHTLNRLLNKGIDIVLISNHVQGLIEKQLTRLGIDQFFSHVYGNEQATKILTGRTKGDKMMTYIKRKGYSKAEVINVGDAPEEIHMARAAGVMSVAITDGFYTRKRLEAEKPDYLITNMMQLINIIERIAD